MATSNLGKSISLQGQYNNDYLQNLQLQEQKRRSFADEAFRQQQLEDKKKNVSKVAIEDAVQIPEGRFLPQRNEEIKNRTVDLMEYMVNKQSINPSYNPKSDVDFQKKKLDLITKAKSYEMERIRAEKDVDEMVRNADIYDKRGIEEGLSVLNGKVPFSKKLENELYQVPKVKDFSKYTKLEPHIESAGIFDTKNETVQKIVDGKVVLTEEKSYDFSTPEKEKEQKLRALEYASSNRNNPYIQRLIAEKEKQFIESAPEKGIVVEQIPNDVFTSTIDALVAEELVKTAKNSQKNKERYIEKPIGKGFQISNNLGGGGSETLDGVFIQKESAAPSEESISAILEQKKTEYFNRWKEKNFKDSKKSNIELKALYEKALQEKSKNDPSLTIGEWNKKQFRTEAQNEAKGLTAISFTPKGDKWFQATASDGKLRKIIPSTVYIDSKGELVKVDGYNYDEETKQKQDLEVFTVNTKNEDNRNSFIGKYPTSIKGIKDVSGVDVVLPSKVVVEKKVGAGTVANKNAAPKKDVAKALTQEEFNKKWAVLKKGESIVAPDGQTYKKK